MNLLIRFLIVASLLLAADICFGQNNSDIPLQTAQFPGGVAAMHKFIFDFLEEPYTKEDSITGIDNKVVVQFVVDQEGKISNPKILQSDEPRFDSAALTLARSMPRWEVNPKSDPFQVKYAIPFRFKLAPTDPKDNSIHASVENPPVFPGGDDGWQMFVDHNINYPNQARRMASEGKVVIQATVNKNGTLSDLKVHNKITRECDAEAIRIISLSPRWIPARDQGKIVRTKILIPVIFDLDRSPRLR